MNMRTISPDSIKKWAGAIIFFAMTSTLLAAQMTMSVSCQTYPSPYLSDWATNPGIVNITITYTGSVPDTVRLEGRAVAREHGEVVSGQSGNIIIPRAQTIQRDNRDFFNYENIEYNENYVEVLKRTGRLLEGSYTLYMKLVKVNTGTVVSEKSCVFYILSFNPPSLIVPEDQDTVLIASPTFQWTQATSHPGFAVRYHFKMCEMMPGQTPQVAMQNIAHHEEVIENATTFIYPNTARPLETTKTYVWQVQAADRNDIPIGENEGRSEIRQFYKAVLKVYVPHLKPIGLLSQFEISRNVNRIGNYFHVDMTVRNLGGEVTEVVIRDVSRGFQTTMSVGYDCARSEVTVQKYVPVVSAGGTVNLSYEAVPVLLDPEIDDYRIGTRTQIKYIDAAGHHYAKDYNSPYVPGENTSYPYPLIPQEVGDAFQSSDYLIITNPERLFFYHDSGAVNYLLSTIATLAIHRNGVLGYRQISTNWFSGYQVKESIERWLNRLTILAGVRGYLLIVGETEIVPSYNWGCHIHFNGSGTCPICGQRNVDPVTMIRITDYPYSDLRGDDRPELKVGRIIGESVREMLEPINASIGVCVGRISYNRTDALLVSGPEGTWEGFVQWTNAIGSVLQGQGVHIAPVHAEYYATERDLLREALVIRGDYECLDTIGHCARSHPPYDIATLRGLITVAQAEQVEADREGRGVSGTYSFFASNCAAGDARGRDVKSGASGKDIISWSGHGGPGSWGWVLDDFAGPCGATDLVVDLPGNPISFGMRAPVVLAASCLTGNYESDPQSIARALLSRRAAIYIGATEVSPCGFDAEVTKIFFRDYWTSTATSVGEAFATMKYDMIITGGGWWPYVCREFNLYGDPKFPARR